ncbi:MAG: glycosyltransferase family 2 protein [Chloroflexi bacterium]|nr:glycosyltransferase family 2 protein [Chloroflexota bacterium]
MKKISIVTGCYNEEENLLEFYKQLMEVFDELQDKYTYEIIIADNNSSDRSPQIIREIAMKDKSVKVILNSRNFGPDRSGYNATMQAYGDAVVTMASDLQNPPAMIKDFIEKWEQGYKVVMTVKTSSKESFIMFFLRTLYYKLLAGLSDVKLISHFTGFGLYDRQVIEILRGLQDPYPYFRGLIADVGFEPAIIEFTQPARQRGKSKSNFLYLYEEAMLGLTSYSKIPLRLATLIGFVSAFVSFLIGLFYLIYKLAFWNSFSVGIAPLAIGLFFFGSIQLIFLGVIGEYISMIYVHVLNRPLVYEKERINF